MEIVNRLCIYYVVSINSGCEYTHKYNNTSVTGIVYTNVHISYVIVHTHMHQVICKHDSVYKYVSTHVYKRMGLQQNPCGWKGLQEDNLTDSKSTSVHVGVHDM